MKKQYFLLVLLFSLICSKLSFSHSIENLFEYPAQIHSLSIRDANNIWLLTSYGEILKTDYLFRNFDLVYKNNKFGFDIKFLDENNGYCLGFADTIFTTNNAGKNWNSILINRKNPSLYSIYNSLFINNDVMLLSCVKFNINEIGHVDYTNPFGVILKKNGNDFIEVFSSPKCKINKIYTLNNLYYAIGNKNLILKSNDQGATWTLLTTKNEQVYNDVCFINENTGYFVGENDDKGFLTITYDGCKNRIYKEIPNSKNLRTIYALNKDSLIILGNENKIYSTVNGGEYFSRIELSNNLNTNLHNFYTLDNNNLLFLATRSFNYEDKEISSYSTSVYKLSLYNFFKEYYIKLSPEKYRNELIAFMQVTAENEATSSHPISKIVNITRNKISESIEENKSLTEEYEFSVNMQGAILGINEFLVKIKIKGKAEFNILGEPKYIIRETKKIYDKKK